MSSTARQREGNLPAWDLVDGNSQLEHFGEKLLFDESERNRMPVRSKKWLGQYFAIAKNWFACFLYSIALVECPTEDVVQM
jgi:hypothetical protein